MDPLAIVKKASSQRAGLLSAGTISSPNTTLPGNVAVVGSLSVVGEVTNNVTGALSLRAFDDTGLYALRTLTAGNPLPTPLSSKPVLEQQISSLNLTNATFGTISAGYSLKINGYVQPPATGTYLFRTTYRDGASLYIATRKLVDSWTYQGTVQQSVGTLTMYQNVWYNFAVEHAAASSAERLLVEWSNPGGTYTTLQHGTGTFTFAYDMKEIPGSLMGTSYVYGRANFADVANLSAGAILPNASFFSGNTSELNNDVGYLKSGFSSLSGTSLTIAGTVSTGALAFAGTAAGTLLQFNNVVSTISGTVTTTAYGAFGVSPGTALERYALNAHRWWTGSSGTTSGTVGMVLNSTNLSIVGTMQAGTATGSMVLTGGGLLIANPTNATPVSGNALHVTGGANIAMDMYIGGKALVSGTLLLPTANVVQYGSGTSQSIPNSTTTNLILATVFGTAQINNSLMSNNINQNCVFTAPSNGVWVYSMALLWGNFVPSVSTSNAPGSNVYVALSFNNGPTEFFPFVGLWLAINIERYMAAGDTIQAAVANVSGSAGNVQGNRFTIHQRCRLS